MKVCFGEDYSPFQYRETCGLRKWGKTKENEGAWYEAVARDVIEKYQSQIPWPLGHWEGAQSL